MRTAEFEEGNKDLFTIALRKLTRPLSISNHLPEVTQMIFAPFWSPEVRYLREKLNSRLDEIGEPVRELVKRNTIYFPNEVFLRASPFHYEAFLRDEFFTFLGINEPETEMHILGNHLKHRYRGAEVPQRRLIFTNREFFYEDEALHHSIIWRGKLMQDGIGFKKDEKEEWQERVNLLVSPSEDGLYVTPAGKERGWFDTYVFPEPDVVTYIQGNYMTAIYVASEIMGLNVPTGELQAAITGYRSQTHEGRLKLSRRFNHKDSSALTGEFLARKLFEEDFLPDQTIRETVSTLDKFRGGFKIVTAEDGSFLNPEDFDAVCRRGDFQNGGSEWLFNLMSEKLGEDCGLPHDPVFWHLADKDLRATNSTESIRTDGTPDDLVWDRAREYNAWNALGHKIIRDSLAKQLTLVS